MSFIVSVTTKIIPIKSILFEFVILAIYAIHVSLHYMQNYYKKSTSPTFRPASYLTVEILLREFLPL